MSIDSDADRDLVIEDEDADSVVGGRETRTKSAKHHLKAPALAAPNMKTISTQPYTLPAGVPQSSQTDCVPELAGDPSGQEAE
jgi:hypothetical protein